MSARESFEDWWLKHLYPQQMKESFWLCFADAWNRAKKDAEQ